MTAVSPTQLTRRRVVLSVLLLAVFTALVCGATAGAVAASEHNETGENTSLDEYSDKESIYSDEPFVPPDRGRGQDQAANDSAADRNASNNSSAPPGRSNGGDGGGLFGISLSPSEWVMSALYGLSDRALDEVAASIDAINYAFVGLPAPGEISSPESWHTPEDGWWPGVYFAMRVAQVLGILWLAFQLAISFGYSSQKKRRASWKRQAVAWVMVLGATLFAPLGLHLFGELATSIVPGGQAFTESFGNFAQFGMGVILGAILVFVATSVVALAILAIVAVYVLAHVVVMFWPIMWAAWSSHGQARSYGSTGIYLYGTVCGIAVIQAFFLLAMFHIDWLNGPLGPLGGLVGLTAGLLFSLVYFPIMLLKQAHLAGAVGLGVAAANSAGGVFEGGKSAAVQKVEQRYRETWKSSDSGGGQSRPSDVGAFSSGGSGGGGSASGSPSRPTHVQRMDQSAGSFGDTRHTMGTVQRRGFSSRFQNGGDARDRVDYSHSSHDRDS